MKFKKILQIITLTLLTIYLSFCVFYFIKNDLQPTYLDCGKIVSKSTDEITIKYGVKTELYLNVQFNNSGFRSVECEPTTYFLKKKGDNVCFYLSKKVNNLHIINYFTGMITMFLIYCFLLVAFIYYMAPDSWK